MYEKLREFTKKKTLLLRTCTCYFFTLYLGLTKVILMVHRPKGIPILPKDIIRTNNEEVFF